jgi:integrase
MQSVPLLDRAGRRRSPATLASFHTDCPPRNKGLRYPPDPPTVEEIIAVMSAAGDAPDGVRLRGLIVALWRAGLRISEALALLETDLDQSRGAILVRHGKGGKRREVGMDRWGWEQLQPWLQHRATLPAGAVLRPPWADTRATMRARRRPRSATQHRSGSPRAASVRAPSAPPRTRRRDVPLSCGSKTGASLVRETTDITEERFFRLAGIDLQPQNQLDAKLAYIRNDLMPKVRAGYWSN